MLDAVAAPADAADTLAICLLRCLERPRQPASANARSLSFVIRPLWRLTGASQLATEASTDRSTVCYVGYDATQILIGPIVRVGDTPCLRCAELWAPMLNRNRADLALPAPLIELLATQVVAYVARWQDEVTDDAPASLWWIDADTLARSTHRLSTHPDCDQCCAAVQPPAPFMVCERRASASTWREHDRPKSAMLLDRLVDPRFGLVRRFERETEAIAHPMTFAAFVGRDNPRQLEIGVGRSGCQAGDQDIAILEALERFSSFRPRGATETVTARYTDISALASDPRSFILPADDQRDEPGFALAAFDSDREYEWTWAHSLRRGTDVLIPLQFVYYDLPAARLPAGQRFVSETSNGCALGASVEEAALFGLFEVLERDAYLTTWYGRLAPTRLILDEVSDQHIAGMIARIEAAGFVVAVLDVGVGFSIAAIAVVAIDRRTDAPVASHLSTGAHLDPSEALRGALVEVCTRIQSRPTSFVAASHDRAAAMLLDDALVRDMDDHASLYALPASLPRLDFLTAGRVKSHAFRKEFCEAGATVSLTETLRALSAEVLTVAEDVLVVDLSNTLTRSVGLHCAKVLAPGILPVTFGHKHRRVSASRIAAAVKMTGRACKEGGAYPPHNFQ